MKIQPIRSVGTLVMGSHSYHVIVTTGPVQMSAGNNRRCQSDRHHELLLVQCAGKWPRNVKTQPCPRDRNWCDWVLSLTFPLSMPTQLSRPGYPDHTINMSPSVSASYVPCVHVHVHACACVHVACVQHLQNRGLNGLRENGTSTLQQHLF